MPRQYSVDAFLEMNRALTNRAEFDSQLRALVGAALAADTPVEDVLRKLKNVVGEVMLVNPDSRAGDDQKDPDDGGWARPYRLDGTYRGIQDVMDRRREDEQQGRGRLVFNPRPRGEPPLIRTPSVLTTAGSNGDTDDEIPF